MDKNLKSDVLKAEAANSLGNGIPSIVGTGNAEAFRYDNPESVKKHIKNLVRPGGSAKVIRGINKLKIAAGDRDDQPQLNKRKETYEDKPQLRKGQIIFGTVSMYIAPHGSSQLLVKLLFEFACTISDGSSYWGS